MSLKNKVLAKRMLAMESIENLPLMVRPMAEPIETALTELCDLLEEIAVAVDELREANNEQGN